MDATAGWVSDLSQTTDVCIRITHSNLDSPPLAIIRCVCVCVCVCAGALYKILDPVHPRCLLVPQHICGFSLKHPSGPCSAVHSVVSGTVHIGSDTDNEIW